MRSHTALVIYIKPIGMAWDLAVKIPHRPLPWPCAPSPVPGPAPVYNICSLQQAVAVLVLHVTCVLWLVPALWINLTFSKPSGGGCSCRVHQGS